MSMRIKYSLDSLVSKAVHSHCYLRVDGVEASNAKYVSDVEREKGIYSSPRNIRKLFIKNSGVDIVYYRPVVGRSDVLSETIRFSSDERKMLLSTYESYVNNINGVDGDSAVVNTNQKIKDYAVTGLTVNDYEFFTSINQVTKASIKKVQAEQIEKNNENSLVYILLDYITKEMCGNRPGGLAANYPRLKYIGFIGNSNYTLKSDGGITKKSIFNYEFQAIYNSMSNVKVLQETLSAGDKFRFCAFVDTGVDLFAPTFRVDTGIYLFDEQYLNDYLKSIENNRELTREEELTRYFLGNGETKLGLESKLGWMKKFRAGELQRQKNLIRNMDAVKQTVVEAIPKVDAVPKTEIERTLTKIYKAEGEKSVQITMKCLEMQYGKDNLFNEMNKFSDAGKEFFMSVYRNIKE